MAEKQATGASGLTPIVVSLAFSMEVYLKCLRMIDGEAPQHTHNLRVLYNDLDERSRAPLDAKYSSLVAGSQLAEPLERALEIAKNAFIDWRYAYETSKSIYVQGLEQAVRAARETTLERDESLRAFMDQDFRSDGR